MVRFTVKSRRAPSPMTRGLMLHRGFSFMLEPERYEAHKALAERLRRLPRQWQESRVDEQPQKEEAPPAPVLDDYSKLTPAQRAIVDKMQRDREEAETTLRRLLDSNGRTP